MMGVGDVGESTELEFNKRNDNSQKRAKTPGIPKRRIVSAHTAKKTRALRGNS